VLVALTPAGLALVDRVGLEHLAVERRMLATLTGEEQATLAGAPQTADLFRRAVSHQVTFPARSN
jgi:DNA-binding MarR family transcriptional regulator